MISIAMQLGIVPIPARTIPKASHDRPKQGQIAHRLCDDDTADKYPRCAPDLFGLNLSVTPHRLRSQLREQRLQSVIAYLAEHGPMTTAALAIVYGVMPEAMRNDIKAMESVGRIQRVDAMKPALWEPAE